MASNPQADAQRTLASSPAAAPAPPRRPRKRRVRLARGPLVIGEPSLAVEPKLALGEPYRADTVIDGGSVYGLTVRAASIRGLSKRWAGEPRQDDICLGRHEPTRALVAAVADGVSGAARSQLGAALAVRQAVGAVVRQLDRGEELDWQEVFNHATWALLDAHRAWSGDPNADVNDAAATLATTLLVAVVHAPGDPSRARCSCSTPGNADGSQDAANGGVSRVQLACVGDSPALMLGRRHFYRLLGAQDDPHGLIGGAVDALPRANASVCSACCTLEQDHTLLLSTDGFSLPLAGGENEVGALFARELARPPDIVDFARLLDFSRSTYDDDRSLIAIWPPGRP